MPPTLLLLYRDRDGTVPLLDWMSTLPPKAKQKCLVRIGRLRELGYELRRPEADYLRDGIYELRASFQGLHYRLLYFFHGRSTAILSHGLVKEVIVPSRDIDLAIARRWRFHQAPEVHAFTVEEQ